jgi:hypothetical protein
MKIEHYTAYIPTDFYSPVEIPGYNTVLIEQLRYVYMNDWDGKEYAVRCADSPEELIGFVQYALDTGY